MTIEERGKLLKPKEKWIPIKTRPLTEEEIELGLYDGDKDCMFAYEGNVPEDGQEVLITTIYGNVVLTTFYNNPIDGAYFESYEDEGEVFAWMPLPEPYKEGKEE